MNLSFALGKHVFEPIKLLKYFFLSLSDSKGRESIATDLSYVLVWPSIPFTFLEFCCHS